MPAQAPDGPQNCVDGEGYSIILACQPKHLYFLYCTNNIFVEITHSRGVYQLGNVTNAKYPNYTNHKMSQLQNVQAAKCTNCEIYR